MSERRLRPGDRVTVAGQGDGVITSIYPPGSETGEYAMIGGRERGPAAPPGYRVLLDGGSEVLAARGEVTPA